MESSSITKIAVLLVIVVSLFVSQNEAATSTSKRVPAKYTNFIKTKCNATTYPYPCLKTLLPYAASVKGNATNMCTAALKVAVQAARNATLTVKDMKKKKGISTTEGAILRDCIDDLKDAVYELKDTLDAMEHLGDEDGRFQWDNAKTYASAVITDIDSCMDGFSGQKVDAARKRQIRNLIYYVTQLASNALSLVTHLY
ncbi:PREDICTED: 21 kDa protein-like [Ipomoea nil]|uniref:21 kDa protein-like n=1 Tax=Ipomoea nil TaxID=35883 RepID=UPI000900C3D3|nr:PREDICTED: 21 kDa protein-like [Ipomoea nil]